MQQSQFTRYLQFYKLSQRLKFVKRAGWCRFPEIQDVESVSDHSWMVALIGLALPNASHVNRDLCMKIALLHDLAEVVVGDITPHDKVEKKAKKQIEDAAFQDMVKDLDPEMRSELKEVYDLYENGDSIEAQIVKDIDKFEMMLQAFQYERKYPGLNLEEFYSNTKVIKTDVVKPLLQELLEERKRFWNKQ